jgi:ATP-binding cassette subfamily B protein
MRSPGRHRRRVPFVQQLSATECGPACLAMVLGYHGRTVSVGDIADKVGSARDGTNAHALAQTAGAYQLSCRVARVAPNNLRDLNPGTILHWRPAHFVVFGGTRAGRFIILDPAVGRRVLSAASVTEAFTGVVIESSPLPTFQRDPAWHRSRSVWPHFLQLLNERTLVVTVLSASVVLAVAGLITPALTRLIVDHVIPDADFDAFRLIAIGLGATAVAQSALGLTRSYILLYLRARLDLRLTRAFVDHLLSLPFDYFQRRSIGDVLVGLGANASVRDIVTTSVLSATLDGTVTILYFALLVTTNAIFGAVAIVFGLLQMAVIAYSRRQQRRFVEESLSARARSQAYIMQVLIAIEAVKAMGGENLAVDEWWHLFVGELDVTLRRGRLDAVLNAVLTLLRAGSAVALLLVGASQVINGSLSLGNMFASIAIANAALSPLINLVTTGSQLQFLVVYVDRLDDVLKRHVESPDMAVAVPRLTGHVTVEQVSFRYGPSSPLVVRDVTLRLSSGESVALVGRSGSGKSTIGRMLVGLYPPTSGRIVLDDWDLGALPLRAVRRQLGVVTQQAMLLPGTIAANILFAARDASPAAMREAAQLACIHDDIERLPLGYDTVIGERGNLLSGGQQQRIAIARALIAKPAFLVLDEATSQLDERTEEMIMDHLASLGCTRLVISHRLATIKRCQRIIVVKEGGVSEEGDHDFLIRNKGEYAAIFSRESQTY